MKWLLLSSFDKDKLFWAGFGMYDDDDHEIICEDYLFEPEHFSNIFWQISFQMAQLNDYCVLTLQAAEDHYATLLREKRKLEKNPHTSAEELDVLCDAVSAWEDNVHVVSQASCVILLSAFLERALKLLCTEFAPGVQVKKLKRTSDIDSYLAHLKNQCGLSISEDTDTAQLRNVFRKIRNDFAHGSWDNLKTDLANLNLRDAFGAVSNLLCGIENAAWDSEWGKQN